MRRARRIERVKRKAERDAAGSSCGRRPPRVAAGRRAGRSSRRRGPSSSSCLRRWRQEARSTADGRRARARRPGRAGSAANWSPARRRKRARASLSPSRSTSCSVTAPGPGTFGGSPRMVMTSRSPSIAASRPEQRLGRGRVLAPGRLQIVEDRQRRRGGAGGGDFRLDFGSSARGGEAEIGGEAAQQAIGVRQRARRLTKNRRPLPKRSMTRSIIGRCERRASSCPCRARPARRWADPRSRIALTSSSSRSLRPIIFGSGGEVEGTMRLGRRSSRGGRRLKAPARSCARRSPPQFPQSRLHASAMC